MNTTKTEKRRVVVEEPGHFCAGPFLYPKPGGVSTKCHERKSCQHCPYVVTPLIEEIPVGSIIIEYTDGSVGFIKAVQS